MLRKLTKLVTNNFGLKVLGIVLAIILWMIIVNVEDPQKTATFSVPVQITNTEYLEEMGKTYEVLDDTDVVTFVVSGNRSVIENLSASDFTATANMENIDESLTTIPIVVTATNYSNQLEITKRTSYVRLNVENELTKNLKLQVLTDGEPAANCFVDEASSTVKTVTVSGPESVVDTVASARVTLNVSGATKSVTSLQQILLYDKDGNEVALDRLTLDETETTVVADIKMKKSVQLAFTVTGTPASGYRSGEIESDVKTVTLVGDAQTLTSLEILTISDETLDISNATANVTAEFTLADYLPDDVELAEGEPSSITVTIPIEAQTSADIEMPTENLTVLNLTDGLSLTYGEDTVLVHITGYEDELEQIQGEELKGTIDASGLKAGTHSMDVVFSGEYASTATATVSATITGVAESTGTKTGNTGTTGNNSSEE